MIKLKNAPVDLFRGLIFINTLGLKYEWMMSENVFMTLSQRFKYFYVLFQKKTKNI